MCDFGFCWYRACSLMQWLKIFHQKVFLILGGLWHSNWQSRVHPWRTKFWFLILACKTLAGHRVHPWRTECHFARTGRVRPVKVVPLSCPYNCNSKCITVAPFHFCLWENFAKSEIFRLKYIVHKVSTLTRFVAAASLVSQLICIIASKLAFESIFGVCTQFHL